MKRSQNMAVPLALLLVVSTMRSGGDPCDSSVNPLVNPLAVGLLSGLAGVGIGAITGNWNGRAEARVLAQPAPNPFDLLTHNTFPRRGILWRIEGKLRAAAVGAVMASIPFLFGVSEECLQHLYGQYRHGQFEDDIMAVIDGASPMAILRRHDALTKVALGSFMAMGCAWGSSWLSYLHRIRQNERDALRLTEVGIQVADNAHCSSDDDPSNGADTTD